jgi:hypothetical protein
MLPQMRLVRRIRHLHREGDDVKEFVHLLVEEPWLRADHLVELKQHLHVVGKGTRDEFMRGVAAAAPPRDFSGEIGARALIMFVCHWFSSMETPCRETV